MSTAARAISLKNSLKSVNPLNGEVLKTYPEMTPDEINAAIGKADEVYKQWRATTFSERAAILKRIAELYRERREELARLIALEMGKKLVDGRGEIDLSAEILWVPKTGTY